MKRHASVVAQSQQHLPLQVEVFDGENGPTVFIEAKWSKIRWNPLESIHVAIRILLSGALGANLEDVSCTSGGRINNAGLYAAACYCLKPQDVEKLKPMDVQQLIQLAVELLNEKFLWLDDDLDVRYRGRPWRGVVELARSARNQIKTDKLPYDVVVALEDAGLLVSIHADLAPRRPPVEIKRTVTEIGLSHGYRHHGDNRLHFARSDGRAFDINYNEKDYLDIVIEVSGKHSPWIEVQYDEERRDDIVVSRILTNLVIKNGFLFGPADESGQSTGSQTEKL